MEIKTVGVVGLGTMGSQIAVVFARAGLTTIVVEAAAPLLEAGLGRIKTFLARQVTKNKMSAAEQDAALANLRPGTDIKMLADAEYVVEAVFEDMAVKKQTFAALDKVCPPATVLASNTSTLSITELAAATRRPERCLGAHFLIPAALTPIVELVRGLTTTAETIRITTELLKRCGKDVVVTNDFPAFVVNRLYIPLLNEAFFALGEGVASAEEIDKASEKGLGMPLGPLAAADASGLDVILACIETLHRELGDKYRPAPLLVKLVRAGHLGRKAGRGVYEYKK